MKKLIFCFSLIFFIFACSSKNNDPYRFFVNNINLSSTIESRIKPVPENVISWLNDMDVTDNYSYTLTRDEELLFISYIQLLPETFQPIIAEKVIAIYFIHNFTGGGMTMPTFDKKGNMYMVWFYNTEILRRTVSNWINFRENSFFDDDCNTSIRVDCTDDYAALIHTLVHEASHVYDYYNHITPFTEPEFQNESSSLSTDFSSMVWETYSQPKQKYDFILRNKLYGY